ncbi:MAG: hypothetical protein ACLQBX_10225 [Candidatus Limnocylindrales bacterium]
MSLVPFLAARASHVDATVTGHTIVTRAVETTDEHEPVARAVTTGSARPWLAGRARPVDADASGKSRFTRAPTPETSDEGDVEGE